MKLQEKIKAIKLRRAGKTYSNIQERIHVSKSSLNAWFKDLDFSENQKHRILKGRELSRFMATQKLKENRRVATSKIIQEAKEEFKFLKNNSLFLSGLCLYWAEGDKHRQERVKFTNSDEKMVLLMMRWFREICGVDESKFRISLHIHSLHSAPKSLDYWSSLIGVPKNQFQKVFIKPTTLKHRRNILYNGTCGVSVHSKTLFRKIQGWKLGLLDYFSIPSIIN